ncbi:type III pantothenate kinase [Sulfurimonas sp. SAG-AH-194-I05]|nr:type III pantothenate kinase [Sulfurimonas sp. SAG-AH-194-I05]
MLLCDVGNTSYHFLDEEGDYKQSVKTFDPKTITQKVYYICVHSHINLELKKLENWINIATFVNMQHYYKTMGIDRIFACEAITHGVIIDAGSAITVDVVTNNIFEGGFIYPGVHAMQNTYENISSALKYPFNYDIDLTVLPKNSQDAISYGFFKTLYSEVIAHQKDIYLTGGDAQKLLKIFPHAKLVESLIFDGMKKVLKEIL